mmetsp:Transcript_1057/g.2981  ORF Transcript_1057/g.2981 Transcript_1057/m.2981 type:complete len:249 (+) Transcript_1057:1063-1809(+)
MCDCKSADAVCSTDLEAPMISSAAKEAFMVSTSVDSPFKSSTTSSAFCTSASAWLVCTLAFSSRPSINSASPFIRLSSCIFCVARAAICVTPWPNSLWMAASSAERRSSNQPKRVSAPTRIGFSCDVCPACLISASSIATSLRTVAIADSRAFRATASVSSASLAASNAFSGGKWACTTACTAATEALASSSAGSTSNVSSPSRLSKRSDCSLIRRSDSALLTASACSCILRSFSLRAAAVTVPIVPI